MAGFGDILEKLEKTDPLYNCHHDTYSKLKTFGTVVATAVVTAGLIYYVVPRLNPGWHPPFGYSPTSKGT